MSSSKGNINLVATGIILLFSYALVAIGILYSFSHFAIRILAVYFVIANLFSFYRVALTDPGFLPAKSHPDFDLQGSRLKNGIEVVPDVLNNTRAIVISGPLSKEIHIEKYCSTCNVFRPPRASHCNDCGRCVLEKDHHCVWLDTCIGRNNYKFFLYFLCTFVGILAYGISATHSLFKMHKVHTVLRNIVDLTGSAILSIMGSFMIYHLVLSLIDVKSRELINKPGQVKVKFDINQIVKRLGREKGMVFETRVEV